MTSIFRRLPSVATLVLGLSIVAAAPADAQVSRKEGTWVVRDFRFHTGEVLPELRAVATVAHVSRAV
jgi:homoserine O-acetyltransferase